MKRKKVKEPTLNELRGILDNLMEKDMESYGNPSLSEYEVELNRSKIDAILSQIKRSKEDDDTND